jgi:hypothetical protein
MSLTLLDPWPAAPHAAENGASSFSPEPTATTVSAHPVAVGSGLNETTAAADSIENERISRNTKYRRKGMGCYRRALFLVNSTF